MTGVQTCALPISQGLAPQTVEAGTFRGASIMEVPSTVNVITREALEQQAVEGLYEAVRNTAGVTRQQNAGDTYDQIVIRGMEVQNRTNYRLNGTMPIMNFSQVPMEDKERVEVLKDASALYYGFSHRTSRRGAACRHQWPHSPAPPRGSHATDQPDLV